jgi:hypothetical protein
MEARALVKSEVVQAKKNNQRHRKLGACKGIKTNQKF